MTHPELQELMQGEECSPEQKTFFIEEVEQRLPDVVEVFKYEDNDEHIERSIRKDDHEIAVFAHFEHETDELWFGVSCSKVIESPERNVYGVPEYSYVIELEYSVECNSLFASYYYKMYPMGEGEPVEAESDLETLNTVHLLGALIYLEEIDTLTESQRIP